MPEYDQIFKLLLLGDSAVGKTSILFRYTDNSFDSNFRTTIGVDFKARDVELDGKKIRLQIWDTAGQERYRTLTTSFYRGSAGVLFVYDVTKEDTFENIAQWMRTMEENSSTGVVRMVIGNKCDLEQERKVSTERGQQLAESYNAIFFEASAKENVNVDEAFLTMAQAVKVKADKSGGTWRGYGTDIQVNDQAEQRKTYCCPGGSVS